MLINAATRAGSLQLVVIAPSAIPRGELPPTGQGIRLVAWPG